MYDKITEDIGQDYYQQNFPNPGQRFVAWYLRNIHLRDPIQTRDDITDGSDDKQIDAIFVDDDKATVFVIQGKFIGSSSVDAEPLREVLSAWVQMRDLVRLQEVANNKLKQKLSEVAGAIEDDYEVCFELITTAPLTDSARKDLATFQKQLAELSAKDEFPATLLLVDENEIRRRYDIALERENPSLSHSLDLGVCQTLPVSIAGTQVVIAVVPLSECIKFPGIKDGTLFQKNVRQSLGLSNEVNKGIKAAANDPQPANRVFSPQNWIKAKTCLAGINFAIRNYFSMLPLMPQGGREMKAKLDAALALETEDFEYRWAAD